VRSRALWASLLAAALGLGLAAFTRLGRERPADLPAARTPRVAAVAPVAPVALGGAAPEASADRQIVVELRSQPTHAAVYVDDRLRGQTPLELRLPRASAPLALRLQLAGYVRLERQLIPDRDQLLELVLAQQPRARTRRAPAAERRRAFRPFE
jgi:hypothetical protein